MSDHYRTVARKLQKLRNNIRWMFVAHGMARVVLAFALLLIWHYVTDTFLELSVPVRAVMLAVMGGVIGFIFLRGVVYPLTRKLSDNELALLVEQEYPMLKDRLITALQLHRDRERYRNFASSTLTDQIIDEGFEVSSRLRFKEVMRSGRLLLMTLLASGACLAIGAILVSQWDSTARFWVDRLLLSDVNYPRRTLLRVDFPSDLSKYPTRDVIDLNLRYDAEATPPTVWVARGTGLRVIASFSEYGEVPESATVTVATQRESRKFAMRAERRADDASRIQYFSYNIPAVLFDGMQIWVEAGDARQGPFLVNAVSAPSLRSGTEVTYNYPAYMQREPLKQVDTRGLVAPETTQVGVVFESDLPLSSAKVRIYSAGADPRLMDATPIEGSMTRFSLSFPMTLTMSDYEFVLTGVDGLRNTEPYRYSINAERDAPPEVVLDFFGRGLEDESRVPVTLKGEIPLRFSVNDKYGVKDWRLMYRLPSLGGEQWEVAHYFGDVFRRRSEGARTTVDSVSAIVKWIEANRGSVSGMSGEARAQAAEALGKSIAAVRGLIPRLRGEVGLRSQSDAPLSVLDALRSQLATIEQGFLASLRGGQAISEASVREALVAAQTALDSARAYHDHATRTAKDEFTLNIGQLLADQRKVADDRSLATEVKIAGGPISLEVKIEAEDYNYRTGDGHGGIGVSNTIFYSLTTREELESMISRYIRTSLKEELANATRTQTDLRQSTNDFVEKRYSLDFGDVSRIASANDDLRRGYDALRASQLTQARLPDDLARLAERFGNVAQCYIFNDLEPLNPAKDQENAIQTVRLALKMIACEPAVGDTLRTHILIARDDDDEQKRVRAIETILEGLELRGGMTGVRTSFDRMGFVYRLTGTTYDQPATLRMLDTAYRDMLKSETAQAARRELLDRIGRFQTQTLEGLKIAAGALKKWEGFDSLREELAGIIREQEKLRDRASNMAGAGR